MSDFGEPLVTLQHDDGVAAVLREDDGSVWLTGDVDAGGGTGISSAHGSIEGLGDGRMVQGGLLPDGATRAEVVDFAGQRHAAAVGNGAWVIVLDGPMHEPAPVHFTDSDGQTIRPPLPAGWPREPVPDAVEPCPACDGTEWEMVTPLDGSRGMFGSDDEEMQPSPIVVCIRCGHEIRSGGWVSVSLPVDEDLEDEEEQTAREAAWEQERRERDRKTLEQVEIPVYVLVGWDGPRSLGGWGSSSRGIDSIIAMHGEETDERWAHVAFDTVAWEAVDLAAREQLSRLVGTDDWPGHRSPQALSVWRDHHERAANRIAGHAPTRTITIAVDGEPTDAVVAEHNDALAAVLDTGAGRVTITARGMRADTLALVSLDDPTTLAS